MTNYIFILLEEDSPKEERLCFWEHDALKYAREESRGRCAVLVSETGDIFRFVDGQMFDAILFPSK